MAGSNRLSSGSALLTEQHLRLMVEAVKDYAIFMLDADGYVVSWNEGAERIKGYTTDEIVGKHFSVFYTPEALARNWPNEELEIVRRDGRFEDEGWRVRKDGSRFWSNVVITALRDESGDLVGFTKVTRDMTERRRIESLELAERRMSEFLAMLSHELRNPLAPIRNAVNTMYLKNLDDPDLRWARDVIERQVKHMTRLVEDLLDVNRITSGSIRLKQEQVRLAQVVERAMESTDPLLRQAGHQLTSSISQEPLYVSGDMTRLVQVVTNLLNNAIKYTPEGGKIDVRLERDNQDAVIRIRDNGVGIPPDLLRSVFDLFKQGERTLDRSEGGLGIGLTLVRELIARHSGSVEATSEGANQGSEFVVRLPLIPAPSSTQETRSTSRIARKVPRGGPRLMVVDDNPDIAESMVMLLDMWGYEVRSALDGPSAISLARTYQPQIVFLDIGLPGTNGYEVARQLQDLPETKDAVLIALTGYGQNEDVMRSKEAGFGYHIVKPADPDELHELLEKLSAGESGDTL